MGSTGPKEPEKYTPRESELLARVKSLEDDRLKFLDIVRIKLTKLEKELELKTKENQLLVMRNRELENNFKDIMSLGVNGKNKQSTKSDEDDVLVRAKELLFEKTKICKKQELQLEALNNQVDATKEVLEITKDMLNLKNIENDHMQSRLDSLELRVKTEKDRHVLMEKKLNLSKQKEIELTREYETQRNIFKDLKTTYELKIDLLNNQLAQLKQGQK